LLRRASPFERPDTKIVGSYSSGERAAQSRYRHRLRSRVAESVVFLEATAAAELTNSLHPHARLQVTGKEGFCSAERLIVA
jgi:hypothetical protein